MLLSWLPQLNDWGAILRSAKDMTPSEAVPLFRKLATSRMDTSRFAQLDRILSRAMATSSGSLPGLEPIRMAIIGSATTSHLIAGLSVAGLRHGLGISLYEAPYGMYWQELMDEGSELHAFRPEVLLIALDARHLAGYEGADAASALESLRSCWRKAKASFACQIVQQTALPVFPRLMGNNEERMTHSPATVVDKINELLRPASDEEGVDLLALDQFAAVEGLNWWHEAAIWHRSKHEVHPRAAQLYGEQAIRLVAAARGRSAKCLVLDLDNTLWGGVIGDDGLDGITLGQGNGIGEAFADFQRYAKGLTERGIILAVCSKNDESNALEPFEKHPEMVLRRRDIACFCANWSDKASNIRQIAKTLNIGLDSLVFVDDNPVERALIRQELPMVRVPEMPEDPAEYVSTLSAAGYFEGVRVTAEDRARVELYQQNSERARLLDSSTDMESYLLSLRMTIVSAPFDCVGLSRVTQLINKTNQFNLTTERLSEADVIERMNDPQVVTLQARLVDRFGDNGIIAVLIARVHGTRAEIETWLMSCRVLGRRVEEACLNLLAEQARKLGASHLIGRYKPTQKNGIVKDLYSKLGFAPLDDGSWSLELAKFKPFSVPMTFETPNMASV